jgi:hypothetical protein
MGRQLLDWFTALVVLRLMVAALCVLAITRTLEWLQRALRATTPSARARVRVIAPRRPHRIQRSGVRRTRRHRADGRDLSLDSSSN